MNILQLGKYHPPYAGGIETVAGELARGLSARGHRADVLCYAGRGAGEGMPGAGFPWVQPEHRDGYRVYRVRPWVKLASAPLAPALLWNLARLARGYELIHLHQPDPWAALALFLSGYRGRVVVQWHSDIVGKGAFYTLYRPLLWWLLRRADRIVVSSAAYGESSDQLAGFGRKLGVVPLGTRLPAPDHAASVALAARLKTFRGGRSLLVAAGRLVPFKGFDLLLEALAALPADLCLAVAGGGPLGERLARQAMDAGLGERVLFLGDVPRAALGGLFGEGAMLVLPSRHRAESFGMVLVEAMAAGLPLVVSRIPGSGVVEVAGLDSDAPAGVGFACGDAADLVRAVLDLHQHPERAAACGAAGQARYRHNYTPEAMVTALVQVYETVLGP